MPTKVKENNCTRQHFVCHCLHEEDTQAMAKKLADITTPGDVWALYGTLGVGKSVWARAFIKRLSNINEVPSPTFTLVQTYETKHFEIFHFDLYRLKSPEEIWELNMEEALTSAVSLIEWPEKMGSYLPSNAYIVKIETLANGGRRIEISTQDDEKINRLCRSGLKFHSHSGQ